MYMFVTVTPNKNVMRAVKNYSRAVLLLLNVPFAFTNATKQRLRKKAKLLFKMAA